VLRTVDRRTAYRVTGPLAAVLTVCWRTHWQGLRANLLVVRPDLSRREARRLVRRNVRDFLKAWIDLLQIAHRPIEVWKPWLRMQDGHYLEEAREQGAGHGVIIVSLHLGSWEAAIAALQDHFSARGKGLALLAEQVRPIRCFNWLVRTRTRVGCQVIPLNVEAARRGDYVAVRRSGASAVRQIYRVLAQDGVVVMAIDRDLLGTGAEIPFCGRRASIPLGAVEIAARTGAVILPVSLIRDQNDNYVCRGYPPIKVELGDDQELGSKLAAVRLLQVMEPELRAHPEQWHVMQPLFGGPMTTSELGSSSTELLGATI
jgi:KDO2-lipid IV(A) lauroyltransferase